MLQIKDRSGEVVAEIRRGELSILVEELDLRVYEALCDIMENGFPTLTGGRNQDGVRFSIEKRIKPDDPMFERVFALEAWRVGLDAEIIKEERE